MSKLDKRQGGAQASGIDDAGHQPTLPIVSPRYPPAWPWLDLPTGGSIRAAGPDAL